MKRALACLLVTLLLTLGQVSVFAQTAPVPALMNFQGRLARPDGTPVTDGNYTLQLSLYDALAGGTLWWQRILVNVPVRNGSFAARLDFSGGYQNGVTQSSLFGASAVYLEISINGGAPLTPRQRLATVAYAMKANAVPDGSISSDSIADNAITVADIANNAVTSAKILNGTITGADIANATITADKFAASIFNPIAWLLGGNSAINAAIHFLGTTDEEPLIFKVNNRSALQLEYRNYLAPNNVTYMGNNVVGGFWNNHVATGVIGATIWGGLRFDDEDAPNLVTDIGGTVSGGRSNRAGSADADVSNATFATVAGGRENTASGFIATVGGGELNTASGEWATVPGGYLNTASGRYSFAAGLRAKATHQGAFVWGDATSADFASSANNQFLIRASGGVGIGTNAPSAALHVIGDDNNGTMATLKITSDTQHLLLDGNEIDSNNHLYLNNNNVNNVILAAGGGRVGVDVTAPAYKLHVNGSVAAGAFVNTSDGRYKTNVATFPDALDTILNLRGVTFDWKHDDYPGMNFTEGRQIGFLAQEVEKVLPELVTTDQNGYKSVAYANVVPVLVEAVKQQQKQMETLKTANDATKRENAELRAELETLKAAVRQLQNNPK